MLVLLHEKAYLQSSLAQAIITSVNVGAMLFIFVAGGYLGFKTGWAGYELPHGYAHVLLLFFFH